MALHVTTWYDTPYTLRYYTGRLKVYEEDFAQAEEDLSYAFKHCHRSSQANLRRILRLLVPVRPRARMLERSCLAWPLHNPMESCVCRLVSLAEFTVK